MLMRSLSLFFSLTWLMLQGNAGAETTRLYRCENEFGQIEFRQGLCSEGRQQEVQVEDVRMGWDAPAVKVEVKKPKSAARARKASASGQKKVERCFKTRQRLESLNRKMRQGYKAGQGADLRHKRRQYEAYLGQFCT